MAKIAKYWYLILNIKHFSASLPFENHNAAKEDSTSPLLPPLGESSSQLEEESSDLSEVDGEDHPCSAASLSPLNGEHPSASLSLEDDAIGMYTSLSHIPYLFSIQQRPPIATTFIVDFRL